MNILFPNWKNFGLEDITETFEELGHTVFHYTQEPKSYRLDPRFKSELKKYIRSNNIGMVFTSNYFPIISNACHELDIPYISWCYDNPLILAYSKTVFHPCNHIFLFDSQMVQDLQELGVKNAYYLPMAVNTERLNTLKATPDQKKIIEADISFVGSLYTEKHTLYDRMDKLDADTRRYLENIMNRQRKTYGAYIIEDALKPDIIQKLLEAMPVELHEDGMETYAYVYANYFLYRKITQTERTELLQFISSSLPGMPCSPSPLKLYTPEETPFLPNVKNMGSIHYLNEMPLVFRHSKINLNITLRSIKHGIPLRAMDIMGAGGFLLTNYQKDFNRHFVDGTDYVSYTSPEDMLDKIEYYLSHKKERKQIAENGWKKVCKEHTYKQRIPEMLNISGIQ
ncbi:hypothetical protein D7V86_01095 [bacterium D16-51]|nr:hypothetical protein D7V96_04225 [bacterium D16-59]RKI62828.1 hypothetical protein D7V86_01095 [bacterium D16-51]